MSKYPNITVKLAGEDGNAFVIIGKVSKSLRRNGVPDNEVKAFQQEVTNAADYDELLRIVMEHVEVE
jgi:hypothetical protein